MPIPARLAVAVALLGAGIVASESVRPLRNGFRAPAAWIGIDMAALQLTLVGFVLAVAWLLPARLPDTLGLRRSRLPLAALAALVVGTLGLSHAIDGVMTLTRSHEGSVVVSVSRAFQAARGWGLVVALLGSVLAPAVCEELLCRGLVQRSVARAAGPLVAIAVSSVLFGVIHMEWTHGVIAALLGVYLGLAAYWADSTRPAIVAHGVNNLGALLGSQGLLRISAPPLESAAIGLALAAAGLGGAGWAHARRLQREADLADR